MFYVLISHSVAQVEGLVVVNIDEGTVTINPTSAYGGYSAQSLSMSTLTTSMSSQDRSEYTVVDRGTQSIPNLPEEPAKLFKNICKRAKFQMELSDVERWVPSTSLNFICISHQLPDDPRYILELNRSSSGPKNGIVTRWDFTISQV